MIYCRRLHWGMILQVRGTLCNFTVGLKMDRFKSNCIVGLMFADCVVLTLLVALFSDSFACAGTLVFLLRYVLMPADGGCFPLEASHYSTQIRATGVNWVIGTGRGGAMLGTGSGALIATWDGR